MAQLEKILEGKYRYLHDDKQYSEEVFHLNKEDKSNGNFILEAKSHTRTSTGEFLKIFVEYNFTPKYEANSITVKREMGNITSEEIIKVNHKEKTFTYNFINDEGKRKIQKLYFNHFVHLTTPCFATSMIMTQMKKIDPVHRTQYGVYTSPNIWSFESEIIVQDIYVELQELEPVDITIGGNNLKASHCKLLQVDENGAISQTGQDLYLSKYFGIPYKGVFPDGVCIEIERLKSFENQFTKHL